TIGRGPATTHPTRTTTQRETATAILSAPCGAQRRPGRGRGAGGAVGEFRENLVPARERNERGLVVSRRRTTMLGVLLAAGAVALTACQPSAGTAAYVGTQRVTD